MQPECLLICARLPQALAQLRQLPLRAAREGHPGAASLDSGVRGADAGGSEVPLSASRMREAGGGAKLKAIVGGQERRSGARGDFKAEQDGVDKPGQAALGTKGGLWGVI